ncbi:NADP-specific glutamate dehydrogenase [Enterovirga sp. GCM10030262]|uniref:NADP-specific glutamate dehydrogenase n=1 Tax=Enterovirga sp. GCM10030262 TaxID=3273391 RepID=UPI00361FA047
MALSDHVDLNGFIEGVKRRNPGQPEFVQAVTEVAEDIFDFIQDKEQYHKYQILRRIAEPDRVISFRVVWEDDNNNIRVQRGYRVQNNNAIGPYKGGIRFHPTVTESVLKFLAFEQTFKNALTGLPMGGGKGGANFNPKGKSDHEVMRFCQSFMTELYRHVGQNIDVPAGDIGVGGREIGYMFGQYKRITNSFEGVLTGKGLEYGGSLIRTEATGYGAVYFLENMLTRVGNSVEGKRAIISGSGNVATHAAEKIVQLGGKVLTLSDSEGFIHDPEGIDQERIDWVKAHKTKRRGRIAEYADEFKSATFHAGERPWGVECDIAIPCATQNELNGREAETLVANGCIAVSEGANMPTDLEGAHVFKKAQILFAPGKAANAGGVAVSGLEMSQNSARISWKEAELQQLLKDIMSGIHERCAEHGGRAGSDHIDYVRGANIAGFKKVADAMLAYGVV